MVRGSVNLIPEAPVSVIRDLAVEAERLLQIAAQCGYMPADSIEPLNRMVDATIRALFGLLRSPRLNRRSRL